MQKICFPGTLGFFQEILSNHIAGVKFKCSKDAALSARIMAACKMDGRAVKMALYGFFISAPMNHYMNLWMQKWFAGRTSVKSKIGHLLAQMFLVAPIQTLGGSFLLPFPSVRCCELARLR